MRRMPAVILVFLLLAPAAAAAECEATRQLTRLFSFSSEAATGTPVSPVRLAEMRRILARFSRANVEWSLRDTPIAASADRVADGLLYAGLVVEGLGRTDRSDVIRVPAEAEAKIGLAMALLSRLDCSPPLGTAMDAGYETALARQLGPARTEEALGFRLTWRGVATALAILACLWSGALAAMRLRLHQRALRRRYTCAIPVSVVVGGAEVKIIGAELVDISRHGAKVQVDPGKAPPVGTRVTIWIDGNDHALDVIWENTHYFGGSFAHALTQKVLRHHLRGKRPDAGSRVIRPAAS